MLFYTEYHILLPLGIMTGKKNGFIALVSLGPLALVPSWNGLCASRHQGFLTEHYTYIPALRSAIIKKCASGFLGKSRKN